MNFKILCVLTFSTCLLFISCSDTDNNAVNPAFQFPNIENPKISISTKFTTIPGNSKCSSFENDIRPASPEEFNSLNAKDVTEISNNLFIKLNNYRRNRGLSELMSNDTAKFLALQHNDYQIGINSINHDNAQFRFCTIFNLENAIATGENVANGFSNATDVFNAWITSPGHLENIQGNFSSTGIAVTRNSNGVLFFTNIFFR